MKILQRIVDFFLYSNIFIGLCAVGLALTNQLTVEGKIEFSATYLFVFFSTVFTYSYLKYRTADNGNINTAHRIWATNNNQLSKNILLLSLIATACFFLLLKTETKIIVAVLGVVTVFYGFMEIPFIKPKKKLRDFGLLKIFFVALVWSVTTVIVPLENNFIETQMLIFLLLRRFLFILALTLVFEIKDLKNDREYNLKTLAMVFGVGNTKLYAQLILLALMAINLIQYFFFTVPLMNMLSINLSLLVSIACIQPIKKETPEIWYYLVIDGMMLLQFIFVLMAAYFF